LKEGEIESFESCWRRSLLEFSESSTIAVAEEVDLGLRDDKMEKEYWRRKYL
jgi:hypothetical protein